MDIFFGLFLLAFLGAIFAALIRLGNTMSEIHHMLGEFIRIYTALDIDRLKKEVENEHKSF